jgi:hypothetical protein
VTVVELTAPVSAPATPVTDAGGRVRCVPRAAMSDATAARDTKQFGCLTRHPRIGLYKSWTASMDEGWTRWVLDDFKIPYVSLTDSAVKAGALRRRFDVIVIPDLSLREVREGMSDAQVPPPYAGGMGAEGLAALKQFVDQGGHVVLVDGSTELAPEVFGIDVTLVAAGGGRATDSEQIYAPGSILRVDVDSVHPIARGMGSRAALYFVNSTALEIPAGSPARVIARYPSQPESILLSGFLQGAPKLAGKAAAADVALGAGRVTMFGFRPLYRGQSYGTFKMFFNALLQPARSGPVQ